jgi:O-antigen ligase
MPSRLPKAQRPLFQAAEHAGIWYLVAASPVLFGLITWPGGVIPGQNVMRHYSMPILAIEIAVIATAMLGGFAPSDKIGGAPRWVKAALGVLAAIAVYTALFVAPDKDAAILRTCSSAIHALFGLSLAHLFATKWQMLRSLVWPSVVVGTLGYLFLVIVFVMSIRDPISFEWKGFGLGVTNIRQVGFYSAVGACAALGLLINSQSQRTYFVWLIAAACLLAVSFWSGTRSSLVAVAAAFVIGSFAFAALRTGKAICGLLLSFCIGLMISLIHNVPHPAFGVFRVYSSSGGEEMGDVTSGRTEIWLGTVRKALEHPLFGFGESQFRTVVPESGGGLNHPHNILPQVLLQWGIVGAACFFSLAAFLWLRFHRSAKRTGDQTIPAYLVATALLTYSLFEGSLYHPYPIAMLAVALAWVLAGHPSHQPLKT